MAKSIKPSPKNIPEIDVSSVGDISPWDFIWWVHDNGLVKKRANTAKIWICLVNDKYGMAFIRMNSTKYEEACYPIGRSYKNTYGISGFVGGDAIEICKDKVTEIRHAHGLPTFFCGVILMNDQIQIKNRVMQSIWIDPDVKDRIS